MDFFFKNKRISGILTILPQKAVKFEDEMVNYNFSPAKSMKLKLAMGYNEHRIAAPGQTSSDFCRFGLQYLIDNKLIELEEIDALLFVSQSPDYFMPPTSNVLHGHFHLKQDCICMDINQGCAGFELGLIQACLLLDQPAVKKVVLFNADVLSPKVSSRDRNSKPLIGDAASITIVEKCNEENPIYANIKMDGSGALVLNIPAGGFRLPSSPETAIMEEDAAGNFRSKDNLVMQGDEVFNFVQREVPPMIEHLFEQSGIDRNNVDWYMFHQPNKFMLHKLADKLRIPREKIPANIVENFGNASGVTVPTCISFNLGNQLINGEFQLCMAGFGVGLTWSSIMMKVGYVKFNDIIEF
ncbi:MAG: ketoacyl-ACP synthase III [Bacteroidales bacterium]|nr:ketoacyl-ACP synthase III [Bacteroidales bacterium]MBQ2913760.1 ketoacyl-ACP synthase III [Bacteroidales bacterium]